MPDRYGAAQIFEAVPRTIWALPHSVDSPVPINKELFMNRRVIIALALSSLACAGAAHSEPKQHLPLVLYGHGEERSPYQSFFLGPVSYMKKDEAAKIDNHVCLKVMVNIISGWGGIIWKYHPTEPDTDKVGLNLKGSKQLTFLARGSEGGEKVSISYGISGGRVNNDTASGMLDVVLTPKWKRYTVSMKGKDLSLIRNAFRLTAVTGHKKMAFYLDDVRYE